jgi:hypothetical protein
MSSLDLTTDIALLGKTGSGSPKLWRRTVTMALEISGKCLGAGVTKRKD